MSADFIDVDCVVLTHRDRPPPNVDPEILERAREACRAASTLTLAEPRLSVGMWEAATALLYPRCTRADAVRYFSQWPASMLRDLMTDFGQALRAWLDKPPEPGEPRVLEAAVDFTVDYLARLFETAINSRVYVGLMPVAVLLGSNLQELRMDRSDRAPADGSCDLVAAWLDGEHTSTALPLCWDLDVEELAAALQRPGSASP